MVQINKIFPKPIYIGASCRTPIGKFGGALSTLSAAELAARSLSASLERRKSGSPVDFVFMGHARQAGQGPNTARQATVFAGLPVSTPALTLNQACASGLAAIIAATEKIALGKAGSIMAGGVESMSGTPYLLMEARWGKKLGHSEIIDGMRKDGFFCPMAQMLMGQTVDEILAPERRISRQAQDEYALESQRRAAAAYAAGHFKNEIVDIEAIGRKPGLNNDEHRRVDSTLESLAKLPPVFNSTGTVTAGNSSGITDGAAFLEVSSELSDSVQAEILDYEVVSLDPRYMGLGPVSATRNLLARWGLSVKDLEAVELNEAFAGQVIACQQDLKIPMEKLNAWGGAIALGHPIGATGTRIVVTLLSRLRGKKGALGLATLCVSGGQGVSLLVRSNG